MSKRKSILLQVILSVALVFLALEHTSLGGHSSGFSNIASSLIGICITIIYLDRYNQEKENEEK